MLTIDWKYMALAGLGIACLFYIIGRMNGKRDALIEEVNRRKQIEATKLWTDAFSKVINIGGQEVRNGR